MFFFSSLNPIYRKFIHRYHGGASERCEHTMQCGRDVRVWEGEREGKRETRICAHMAVVCAMYGDGNWANVFLSFVRCHNTVSIARLRLNAHFSVSTWPFRRHVTVLTCRRRQHSEPHHHTQSHMYESTHIRRETGDASDARNPAA